MPKTTIAWNEEHQTGERQQMREMVAQHFLNVIGPGEHTIFSLTSAQANCVKTFEQDRFFPRASFVTTERILEVYENIEHPKVTKHFGDVFRFIREQTGNYQFDAAWLDYTNGLFSNIKETARFVDAFQPRALALTFIEERRSTEEFIQALQGAMRGKYEITCHERKLEKHEGKNKFTMEFMILKIVY